MASVLLLHEAGPVSTALAADLTRLGHAVTIAASIDDLIAKALLPRTAQAPIIVIEEDVLVDSRLPSELASFPVILIDRDRRIVAMRPHEGMREESLSRALAREIVRLSAPDSGAAMPLVEAQRRESPPRQNLGALLSGLVHAIRNPMTAATGWLQLLDADLPGPDPRRKALRQALQEVQRLDRLLQALSMIGGRTGIVVPFDIEASIRERAREVEREGLRVSIAAPSRSLPRIDGDPVGWSLALELLLGSFVPERHRAGEVMVQLRPTAGALELRLSDAGGTLVAASDLGDLGSLLQRMRYGRALAIALLRTLIGPSRETGLFFDTGGPATTTALVIRIPTAKAALEEGA